MAYIIVVIIVFLLELFWFIQLLDLMSREDSYFLGKYDKPCWVAVLLAANWLGALAYLMLKPFKESSTSESIEWESVKPRSFKKMPNAPKKCPNCGESFFYNAQTCLACGWSYDEPGNEDSGHSSTS